MAEILIEALGSKNQHEELRDFHSRFDRELDPMQTSSKIIDIHSTAQEPTNHYPELLKDLLDCIPYIEPFGGDSKDRNRVSAAVSSSLCSSFVPISSGELLGASDDFSKQVVNIVEDALENYTDHVKKMQSDLEFNPTGSPYLRNLYRARQLQHLTHKELKPLAGKRGGEWKHSPIHDASILYCRKTTDDSPEDSPPLSMEQQQQQQQQQMSQSERGKYWKSMLEEEENYLSLFRQPASSSRRPQTARPLTPRGSPTPMLEEFVPSKQHYQHQQQQQQQHHLTLIQLKHQPKIPLSPQRPPSSIMLRQLPAPSAKPLRASISDTAITGSPQHLHHHQHVLLQGQQFEKQYGDGIPQSPRQQHNQHSWRGWQQQQQQQQQQQLRDAGSVKSSFQCPPAYKQQPSTGIVRAKQQQQQQHIFSSEMGNGESSRPPSAEPTSQWGLPIGTNGGQGATITNRPYNSNNNNNGSVSKPVGVLWSSSGHVNSNNINDNKANHVGNNLNQNGVRTAIGASISPPTFQAFSIGAAPQRQQQQQLQQQHSIWSGATTIRQLPQQQQQQQQLQQPQQQAVSFVTTQQLLNGRRAFSPPASAASNNAVSLLTAPSVVSSVLQPRSVMGNATASNGATGGVILQQVQQPSRLVEVKSLPIQPIQLVQARPAGVSSGATFLTIPVTAAAAAAAGGASKSNGSSSSNNVVVPPLVAVNRLTHQQQHQQKQQQLQLQMSPPRTRSSSLYASAGEVTKPAQQPTSQRLLQLSPPHQRPQQQQQPIGGTSAGGPFQVSLPDGKLIADNNRVWMDGIVSILEKKSKEGKEAAAAAAAINNSIHGITPSHHTNTTTTTTNNIRVGTTMSKFDFRK